MRMKQLISKIESVVKMDQIQLSLEISVNTLTKKGSINSHIYTLTTVSMNIKKKRIKNTVIQLHWIVNISIQVYTSVTYTSHVILSNGIQEYNNHKSYGRNFT